MDTTSDVVGSDGGSQEKPVERLRTWLEAQNLPKREQTAIARLVELTDAVLRLDQRLAHVRDEAGKGEPPITWEEIRRAAFLTAVVCYELDRLS
jgi:hypothetical protein